MQSARLLILFFFFILLVPITPAWAAKQAASHEYGYRLGDGYYGPYDAGTYYASGDNVEKSANRAAIDEHQAPTSEQSQPLREQSQPLPEQSQPNSVSTAAPNAVATLPPTVAPAPRSSKLVIPVDAKPAPAARRSLFQLMQEGKDYFAQNAFHAAIDAFDEAAQQSPDDQDVHFWLAMAYWHLYDYENARGQLDIVFRLNPFNTEGRVAKSQMLDLSAYLAKRQSPPADSGDMVRQTLGTINRQADQLQRSKINSGRITAARRLRPYNDPFGYHHTKSGSNSQRRGERA